MNIFLSLHLCTAGCRDVRSSPMHLGMSVRTTLGPSTFASSIHRRVLIASNLFCLKPDFEERLCRPSYRWLCWTTACLRGHLQADCWPTLALSLSTGGCFAFAGETLFAIHAMWTTW